MKTFAIFRIKERKNTSSPDYNIVAKIGDKFVSIGGAWIKDGKNGKYFSCKLSDTYQDRIGYSLIAEDELEKLQSLKAGEETKKEVSDYPANDLDIPFN